MLTEMRKPALPSEDKRWRIVQATMNRNGYGAVALIESLHAAQSAFGYIDDVAMRFTAQSLSIPLSKVYGVATFYHLFTLKPAGDHSCVICTGTACFIRGAGAICKEIEKTLDTPFGQTTPDDKVSLMQARCLGACGNAVAATFDSEFVTQVTSEVALERIRRWTQ